MKVILAITLSLLLSVAVDLQGQTAAFPDSSGRHALPECIRLKYPALQSSLPLHTDMSWQTLLGYVWLDSLMRKPIAPADWDKLSNVTSRDSIMDILKYLYAVTNYDPILFHEYKTHAQYLNSSYWGRPGSVVSFLEHMAGENLLDSEQAVYLASISYILHVQVLQVDRAVDSEFSSAGGHYEPVACVEAVVLDTIKGRSILATECAPLNPAAAMAKNDRIASSGSPACLHFNFLPGASRAGSDLHRYLWTSTDSLVFLGDALTWDAVIPGGDYIVFLDSHFLDYDGTFSYYSLQPVADGSGGIYPVIGGKVHDSLNRWRMGNEVEISAFKAGLRAKIQALFHQ